MSNKKEYRNTINVHNLEFFSNIKDNFLTETNNKLYDIINNQVLKDPKFFKTFFILEDFEIIYYISRDKNFFSRISTGRQVEKDNIENVSLNNGRLHFNNYKNINKRFIFCSISEEQNKKFVNIVLKMQKLSDRIIGFWKSNLKGIKWKKK